MSCECDRWGMCGYCERRLEGDEQDARNEAHAVPEEWALPEEWDFLENGALVEER